MLYPRVVLLGRADPPQEDEAYMQENTDRAIFAEMGALGLLGVWRDRDGNGLVRGFDLSDISFVRGKTGWIVFDPLVTDLIECRAEG
jgi:alkyl sulfatase BDS1-like metallo-beta-lactamase superfamily hydrolase